MSQISSCQTDMEKIGPGYWDILSNISTEILHNISKFEETKNMMLHILSKIQCDDCTPHIKYQIENDPMDNYKNIRIDGMYVGLCKWIWQFHNSVNTRKNKPQFSWNDFVNKYINIKPCKH